MAHDFALEPRRIDLRAQAPQVYDAMIALDRSIQLDHQLRELVKIRASILNGCAFCIDMHTLVARKAGETEQRLYAVAAWHEAPFFTPKERAALAMTDAMTKLDERVPRDVWDEARKHFDEKEMAQLIWAITAINAWNRIAISTRIEAGHFKP